MLVLDIIVFIGMLEQDETSGKAALGGFMLSVYEREQEKIGKG